MICLLVYWQIFAKCVGFDSCWIALVCLFLLMQWFLWAWTDILFHCRLLSDSIFYMLGGLLYFSGSRSEKTHRFTYSSPHDIYGGPQGTNK